MRQRNPVEFAVAEVAVAAVAVLPIDPAPPGGSAVATSRSSRVWELWQQRKGSGAVAQMGSELQQMQKHVYFQRKLNENSSE